MINIRERPVSIDSSVWIDFFRDTTKQKYPGLRYLIRENLAAVCEPVVAEVLSYSKSEEQYEKYKYLLLANIILEEPDGIWEKITYHRCQLLRQKQKISFEKLWTAYSAYDARAYLWTLDEDFKTIQKVIPFMFYQQ